MHNRVEYIADTREFNLSTSCVSVYLFRLFHGGVICIVSLLATDTQVTTWRRSNGVFPENFSTIFLQPFKCWSEWSTSAFPQFCQLTSVLQTPRNVSGKRRVILCPDIGVHSNGWSTFTRSVFLTNNASDLFLMFYTN